MSFEVEIKIKLNESERNRFEKHLVNSVYLGTYSQEDYYFDSNIQSFAQLDKALRVRIQQNIDNSIEDKKIEMTYKGPKIQLKSKTRSEINIILEKNTEFETIKSFLHELNFELKYKIEKVRQLWVENEKIYLSIDRNELGYFLEIEQIIENKDKIEKVERELWDFIQAIIGKIDYDRKITKSYLELILESKEII